MLKGIAWNIKQMNLTSKQAVIEWKDQTGLEASSYHAYKKQAAIENLSKTPRSMLQPLQ
jgi:hypothetical protein